MTEYPQNTSGTTTDGILAALVDLIAVIRDLADAVRANTLAVGSGAPHSGTEAGSYIDADSGDVYTQQQQGSS